MTAPPAERLAEPAEIAVAFTRILRGLGLNVPTSCTHTFAEALSVIGIDDRDGAYWSGRATLVRRPEDIGVYDRAFAVFFEHRRGEAADAEPDEPLRITLAVDDGRDDDEAPRRARPPTTRRSSCASRRPRPCATRTSPSTPTTSSTARTS